MLKKFFMAILAAVFLSVNFSSVICAKTPEEKAAKKEEKLLKKHQKELKKIYRDTNILKVEEWAKQGDLQAMLILAYAKDTNQYDKKDKEEIAKIRRAIARENSDLIEKFIPIEYVNRYKINLPRLYGLAACYSHIGQYVEQNFDDSIRWAELGASENDTLSFAVLASAYYTGRGVRQDFKKAIEYCRKALKEPLALQILADAYKNGNGVEKDLNKSAVYTNYLNMIMEPKIDKKRAKNQKNLDR